MIGNFFLILRDLYYLPGALVRELGACIARALLSIANPLRALGYLLALIIIPLTAIIVIFFDLLVILILQRKPYLLASIVRKNGSDVVRDRRKG